MRRQSIARVLSVGPDSREQDRIGELLESASTGVPHRPPFEITALPGMERALLELQTRSFDALLVSLPVGRGAEWGALELVREQYPNLPVVLILDQDDEPTALRAAERGVQDCIVRNELVGNLLARSLEYAMERQELAAKLERRTVVDELTGLYNRRGFFAVGEQELRRARRRGNYVLLVFADIDGLKRANDCYGHVEGDALIKGAAELIGSVFRDTDILARLGGDEFAVIAHQISSGGPEAIRERLRKELERFNGRRTLRDPLSLSSGLIVFQPAKEPAVSLDKLLSRADALMYQEKQGRARA